MLGFVLGFPLAINARQHLGRNWGLPCLARSRPTELVATAQSPGRRGTWTVTTARGRQVRASNVSIERTTRR